MNTEKIDDMRKNPTDSGYMICPECEGTGKELCSNPDHGFINAIGGETGRLGCPVCGHDEYHRTKYNCTDCSGTGKIKQR